MSAQYVWLASYPKSGNTWIRMMLESLTHGGTEPNINALEFRTPILTYGQLQDVLGLDATELSVEEIALARPEVYRYLAHRERGPQLFRKVHDRFWHNTEGAAIFPEEVTQGVIYIARDPRDVALSLSSFFGECLDATIERMDAEDFCLSDTRWTASQQLPQPLGRWSTHVQSWLKCGLPLLLLRYEDLLSDPVKWLDAIADFAHLPRDYVLNAVRATKFQTLAEQEARNGFRENPSSSARFFRSGRSGGWKTELTREQCSRLTASHGEVMLQLGYDTEY